MFKSFGLKRPALSEVQSFEATFELSVRYAVKGAKARFRRY